MKTRIRAVTLPAIAAATIALAAPVASAHPTCTGASHNHAIRHYSLSPPRTWTTTERWEFDRQRLVRPGVYRNLFENTTTHRWAWTGDCWSHNYTGS